MSRDASSQFPRRVQRCCPDMSGREHRPLQNGHDGKTIDGSAAVTSRDPCDGWVVVGKGGIDHQLPLNIDDLKVGVAGRAPVSVTGSCNSIR